MDLAFKSFEPRHACEHCKSLGVLAETVLCNDGRKHKVCQDCKKPIPFYYRIEPNGYQSASPHHFHLEVIDEETNKSTWVPIMVEMCAECYLADYLKLNPTANQPDLSNHPPVHFSKESLAVV